MGKKSIQQYVPYGALLLHARQRYKEFALGGKITRHYMKHERKLNPAVPKTALREIILGGGQDRLSPERRFDATIYFTAKHLFEEAQP